MMSTQEDQTISKTNEIVEKVHELVLEDRRRTIRQLSDMVGISYRICQEILTQDLNMRRVAAKFVPRQNSPCTSSAVADFLMNGRIQHMLYILLNEQIETDAS